LEDTFLTVAEVADLLKINQQTVRNWIAEELLPAVRIGRRRVRIREADLAAFVDASETHRTAAGGTEPRAVRQPDELLSRKELAQRLQRSLRWVDARVAEGMPSEPPTDDFPHRRFRLPAVEDWLHGRTAAQPADRSTASEAADVDRFARALSGAVSAGSAGDLLELASALRAVAGAAERLAGALELKGSRA